MKTPLGTDWTKIVLKEQDLGQKFDQRGSDTKPGGAHGLDTTREEHGGGISGWMGFIADASYFSKMPLILKHQALIVFKLLKSFRNLDSELFQIDIAESL